MQLSLLLKWGAKRPVLHRILTEIWALTLLGSNVHRVYHAFLGPCLLVRHVYVLFYFLCPHFSVPLLIVAQHFCQALFYELVVDCKFLRVLEIPRLTTIELIYRLAAVSGRATHALSVSSDFFIKLIDVA